MSNINENLNEHSSSTNLSDCHQFVRSNDSLFINIDFIYKAFELSNKRAFYKMLIYALNSVDNRNEFVFETSFINSYKSYSQFFRDRKFLLKNQYIFNKQDKKHVYTLNVGLFSQCKPDIHAALFREQFGRDLSPEEKLEYQKKYIRLLDFNTKQHHTVVGEK